MTASRVKQLNDLLADAVAIGDDDQIEIIKQEIFTINPRYIKEGGLISPHGNKYSGGAALRGYGKARN